MSSGILFPQVMRPDDARLSAPVHDRLEAVRRGDARALEAVLVELLPSVRRWLARQLGPRADLDDATQDALIELARALPSFEGRARLTTFAHRVTLRVAYRYYGRRGETLGFDADAVAFEQRGPEGAMIDRQAVAKLYRILDKLPEKRRIAFVLCVVEGYTPEEAADVAGTSSLAMRTRLHYARAEVLRMMGGDPAFAELVQGGRHGR